MVFCERSLRPIQWKYYSDRLVSMILNVPCFQFVNVRSQHIPICWKRHKKTTINWEEISPLVAGFEKHRGWIHMGEVSQFTSRTLAASSCSRVWRAGDGNGRWIGYFSRKALLSKTFYIFGFWTGRCFPNKSPHVSPLRPCRASHTSWFWDYERTQPMRCIPVTS